MIKEFIIRVDNLKDEKKLEGACKKLCHEYDGEYLTRLIDKNYRVGVLQIVNTNKDKTLFWERRQA